MSSTFAEFFASLPTRAHKLASGDLLFRIDQKVRSVFGVEAGAVHLTRHLKNGSTLILQRASAGMILAEASLYSDRYHCDAVAAVGATLLEVPRREVLARLSSDPEFAAQWSSHLAHQLQQARLQTEIMALKTVSARLDAWVAMRGSAPSYGKWVGVAAEIGVSPEALYRELAKRRRS